MRNKIFFIFFLILIGGSANSIWAQSSNREIGKLMFNADYLMETLDYKGAVDILRKAYAADSANAGINYKLGKCIFMLNEDKSLCKKYLKLASDSGLLEAQIYYARCLHDEHKFDEAIALFKKYKGQKGGKWVRDKEIELFIRTSSIAKQMVKDSNYVAIALLEGNVNSKYSEYMPLVNANESVMYFSSRRPEKENGETRLEWLNYDIMVSNKVNGKWETPTIVPELNTFNHDICSGISSDGSTMIVYRPNNDFRDGDFYFTRLEGDTWSMPLLMRGEINTVYGEKNACLSSKGNTIYFSSNRPGGFGGYDLYVVRRLTNGEWGKAYNLGSDVNSPLDEITPYIYANDEILYFSSNGKEGMGGFDIYETEMLSDTMWTPPYNLGYPINTVKDDKNFILAPDTRHGYYSTTKKGGVGDEDIYIIRMPYQHKSLGIIEGFVYASDSYQPVKANITVKQKENIKGIYYSNSKSGKYLLVLEPNVKYTLFITAEGFEPASKVLEFDEAKGVSKIKMDLQLFRSE